MKDHELGPIDFSVGYTADGDTVEYLSTDFFRDDEAYSSLIIQRSHKTIVKAMKKLEAKIEKTRDEFKRGLIVGRLSALNWVLGEPWDRSVVDVFATSSSRDYGAIQETLMEFQEKAWYNRSLHHIRTQNIVEGSNNDQGYSARVRMDEKYDSWCRVSTDLEWGVLSGRLSGLAWACGVEWKDSLNT